MAPTCTRNNKTKKKKNKEKGGVEVPPLPRFGHGAHLHPEERKPKKGRRGGAQASLLRRLGHGAPEATKK
jgi:hypothetical protein